MSETAMDIDPQEGPSTEKSNTESKKTLGYEMPWYMLQSFIYPLADLGGGAPGARPPICLAS